MKIILPREELRPYVRYYWMLENNEPFSVLTFPIAFRRLYSTASLRCTYPNSNVSKTLLPSADR